MQVAFPLTIIAVVALVVLLVCRLRVSSPEEITAEIKRELRNKGDTNLIFISCLDLRYTN